MFPQYNSTLRPLLVLWFVFLLPSQPAFGESFLYGPVAPNAPSRYREMVAPDNPTSRDQCDVMEKALNFEWERADFDHENCLQGAPRDEHGDGGACSKASCQRLHDLRDNIAKQKKREVPLCRERVDKYVEYMRQQQRFRQEQDQRRQREMAEAQRNAVQEARQRQEQEENRARLNADRNTAIIGLAGALMGLWSNSSDRAERARQAEQERAQQEQARQAAEATRQQQIEQEKKQAREAKNQEEQSLYQKLIEQVSPVKTVWNIVSAENPWQSVKLAVAETANQRLVESGIDTIFEAGGPTKKDQNYESIVTVANQARAIGTSGNPFAEAISGLAFAGTAQAGRRTLEQVDQISNNIDTILQTTPPEPSHSDSPVQQPSSAPQTSGNAAIADNPFTESAPPVSPNKQYLDTHTGQTLDIPPNHVLYRDPSSMNVVVLPASSRSSRAVGDRPELGERGCSITGTGFITEFCEQFRSKKAKPLVKAGR